MTNHPQFRFDNTDGYSAAELAVLNERYDALLERHAAEIEAIGELEGRSFRDHLADHVLVYFDAD